MGAQKFSDQSLYAFLTPPTLYSFVRLRRNTHFFIDLRVNAILMGFRSAGSVLGWTAAKSFQNGR